MLVRTLTLENFRNYEVVSLLLAPRINLLIGENAQGKTNLLEALNLLSTTRLLRGSRENEAIRHGANRATVSAELGESGTTISIVLEHGLRKKALVNSLALPRASDIIGRLPSVCFSNSDLGVVREEPAQRRLFLDSALSQLYPGYLRHFASYRRALEQRNALLKVSQETRQSTELFEAWELELAHHGAALRKSRMEYVDKIAELSREIHDSLAKNERLVVVYEAKDKAEDESSLLEAYAKSRTQEISRGTTIIGPHRDDLCLSVDEKDARLYGSQGQQRTVAIALKLASLIAAHQVLGILPLLLLDDIFSELDNKRRENLLETALDHAGQIVLTCTEAEQAGDKIVSEAKIFHVESGRITAS